MKTLDGTTKLIVPLCCALLVSVTASSTRCEPLLYPSDAKYTAEDAQRMAAVAQGVLAPVYAPLAEQIVRDFDLADKPGIGIDVGSGHGTLIIELCKRTRMHWINADINPHVFPIFFRAAEEAGLGGRVSAVFADAQAMPFRDNFADIIVSRGVLQFWEDKQRAFSEIYRVLKPGGVAFIGRGFSDNLPVDVARKIRAAQTAPEEEKDKDSVTKYKVSDLESELRQIMKNLNIERYKMRIPKPPGSEGIKYGIWIEIHK